MPHNHGKTADEIAERIAKLAQDARSDQNIVLSAKDLESIKADMLEAVSKTLDRSLARFKI